MAMLTRLRTRTARDRTWTRTGAAVVVHATEGITHEARAFASALPADPANDLVVVDLPADAPHEVWQSVVAALPKGRRPLRVVPGRAPREVAPYVWQWLADQVGRPVLAPYGRVHATGGGLFADAFDQSGWMSFRRGVAPVWHSKRFPCPAWDCAAVAQVRAAGFRAVAEPLPSGVWLRPDTGPGVLATARNRLTAALPCLPDAPLIVLGARDAAPVDVADVVAYMRSLPPATAAAARFVSYGDLRREAGGPIGAELADALGTEVVVYAGIPTGSPDALDVLALLPDGSLGVSVFAQAFAYRPGGGPGLLYAHRGPDGLVEVSPGVYWCSQGIVAEVVPAGLWVRPAKQTTDPAGVRTAATDPQRNLVLYEENDVVRGIAGELLGRLNAAARERTVLVPTTTLPGAAVPAPEPEADPDPGTPDTDLHWLSRMLETTVLPMPVRAPEKEAQDDRVRGGR